MLGKALALAREYELPELERLASERLESSAARLT
jgi:hypothetical protein